MNLGPRYDCHLFKMTFSSRSRFDRQADSDPQPYSRQGCGHRQVIRTVKDRVLSQQARDDLGPEAANKETAKDMEFAITRFKGSVCPLCCRGHHEPTASYKRRGRLSPLASRMLNSDRLAGGSGSRTLAPHRGQHFSKLPRSSVGRAHRVRVLGHSVYVANRGQRRKSLIRRINSLMARFNSLLGRNKFPVPLRRELGPKPLYSWGLGRIAPRCLGSTQAPRMKGGPVLHFEQTRRGVWAGPPPPNWSVR